MKYPSFARPLLGATGFSLDVTGRRKNLLLGSCDRLFKDSNHDGEVTILVEGTPLRLNLANPSERVLNYAPYNLLRRYRKSDLFWLLTQVAGESGLFIDIGANLGIFSYLARTLGLDTILFEPEPIHQAFLRRNAAAIGRPFACALSDKCGKMEFFLSNNLNPGSGSLVVATSESNKHHAISVDVSTFDQIAAEMRIDLPSVKLIKIDVEGNEEHTVAGMHEYLGRADAAPIWCEVRGPANGRCANSVSRVASYMEGFGFEAFQCSNRHFETFRVGIDPTPHVFDLLFAVPSRHGKLLAR